MSDITDYQMNLLVDQIKVYKNPDEWCIQRRFEIDDVCNLIETLKL